MGDERTVSGVLDWSDAGVGDPVLDYVGVRIVCGVDGALQAAAAAGYELDLRRLRHYWWMGALHAVLFGVSTGDEDELRAGVEGLGRRLAG
jgi:aminoglycoside phosphotransferase (APT) family kinase protein